MTAEYRRNKAIETFNKYINAPVFANRFTKVEMMKELNKVNEIITKELSRPKEFRKVAYLHTWFSQRHYNKKLVSLFTDK